MTHLLEVSLVEVAALLVDEVILQAWLIHEFLGTHLKQLLSFLTLLLEGGVHGILIEAIHKFNEIGLQKLEVLAHSNLEGLERLGDKLLFVVLGGQSEDVDDHGPS